MTDGHETQTAGTRSSRCRCRLRCTRWDLIAATWPIWL